MDDNRHTFLRRELIDDNRHTFLRRDYPVYNLSANEVDRIIARGIKQDIRWQIATSQILPLVNSEAHILCSDVDVTGANVAFGRWAIPKLKSEILSSDPFMSKRAIVSLLDLVHDPERAVEAIKLQVLPRLVRLMVSEDPFVRQRVLMIIGTLAHQPGGKRQILGHRTVMSQLATLLADKDERVRLAAAKAVRSLASWYIGVRELIENYFIEIIINQLNVELEDDIMVELLVGLECLLAEGPEAQRRGLAHGAMELAVLLENPAPPIRAAAAATLAQLLRRPDAKVELVCHRNDLVTMLAELLHDSDMTVRTHAAEALTFATITTEAKLRCVKTTTVPGRLLDCAKLFRVPGLQLNAIKALTSLAESPAGQCWLKERLRLVTDIRPADSIVQRHKDILLSVINRVV